VILDAELAALVTMRAPVGPLDLPALVREAVPGLVDVDAGTRLALEEFPACAPWPPGRSAPTAKPARVDARRTLQRPTIRC